MVTEYKPKRKMWEEDQRLMRRAREKWHEWKKDPSKNLGVGF